MIMSDVPASAEVTARRNEVCVKELRWGVQSWRRNLGGKKPSRVWARGAKQISLGSSGPPQRLEHRASDHRLIPCVAIDGDRCPPSFVHDIRSGEMLA